MEQVECAGLTGECTLANTDFKRPHEVVMGKGIGYAVNPTEIQSGAPKVDWWFNGFPWQLLQLNWCQMACSTLPLVQPRGGL